MKRPTTHADTLAAAGIFLLAFGYYYLFRRLGWFMQDEGVLYYQYLRTFEGQMPYRDFFTGYPPLVYYLHALIFEHLGISVVTIRTVMAVVNSATATALYLVARRVAPRGAAVLPSLLFMVMQPGDITNMGFHNSPYPSWYAVAFLSLTTLALLRALEAEGPGRRDAWLLATGVLGSLTFLSKQNAGIFILWGVTGLLASLPAAGTGPARPGAGEPPLLRTLRLGYLALVPAAAVFLIAKFLSPLTVALFVAPAVVLGALGAREAFPPAAWRRMLRDFLLVGAGFAAGFLPWLIHFGSEVGAGVFLRELFLVGKNVDENLYVPFPEPGALTLAVLGVAAVTLAASLVRRRRAARQGRRAPPLEAADLRAGLIALLALVAGVLLARADVLADLLAFRVGPGEIYLASAGALDDLAAYAAALILWTGLAVAWRQARGGEQEGDPPRRAFRAVLWCAACAYILYFPRMDAAHLYVGAAPLIYVLGAALLPRARLRVAGAFSRPARPRATLAFNAACVLIAAFVIGSRTMPKVYSVLSVKAGPEGLALTRTEAEWLRLPRLELYFPIYLEEQRGPIREFGEVVRYVRDHTEPGDPIFAFPAIPMIYFVSERQNPTRQDYFFGNNVGFQDQLDVLRKLEQERVPLVITVNNPNDYFVAKVKRYTRLIQDYIGDRYYLERRIGRYDVKRRFGTAAAAVGGRGAD